MIIKSLSRKSNPSQLIAYATRYLVKDGKNFAAKDQMKILLEHNLRNAHTVEEYIAAFKENESYRIRNRKDNVVLFHTILSLSPDDKETITQPMLTDLARQFIEFRGTNCLHLAVGHLEKSHTHIHIITSGVTVGGKSSRMSHDQFTRLLNDLESYQQKTFPELIHSENTHEKKSILAVKEFSQHLSERRKNTKQLLHDQVRTMIQYSTSYSVFCQQLTNHHYDIYHRNGTPQGVVVNGMKYRFTSLGIEPSVIAELRETELALSEISELRKEHAPKHPLLAQIENIEHPKELEEELQGLRHIHSRMAEENERIIEPPGDCRGTGLPP